MLSWRKVILASALAGGTVTGLTNASPVFAVCLESGEYEQAIADTAARDAARAQEANAQSQANAETQAPASASTGAVLPAEVAATANATIKPN